MNNRDILITNYTNAYHHVTKQRLALSNELIELATSLAVLKSPVKIGEYIVNDKHSFLIVDVLPYCNLSYLLMGRKILKSGELSKRPQQLYFYNPKNFAIKQSI